MEWRLALKLFFFFSKAQRLGNVWQAGGQIPSGKPQIMLSMKFGQ